MRDFLDNWGFWLLAAAWWLFVAACAYHREIEAFFGGAL